MSKGHLAAARFFACVLAVGLYLVWTLLLGLSEYWGPLVTMAPIAVALSCIEEAVEAANERDQQ